MEPSCRSRSPSPGGTWLFIAAGPPLRQPVHCGGEGVAAGPVVGEHVHGGRGRGEEDDVTRAGSVESLGDDTVHDASLRRRDVDDTDIGRVSPQSLGEPLPVRPDEDRGAQARGRGAKPHEDAPLRRELLRRDKERIERDLDALAVVRVEHQNAPLLDERARERLRERALRQGEIDRLAAAFLLGLVLGAVNLYYELHVVQDDLTGIPIGYRFPFGVALLLLPVILGAALAASILPAETAVRGSLVDALKYE